MSIRLFWHEMRKNGVPTQADELLMAFMLIENAQNSLSDAGACLPEYHGLRKQLENITQWLRTIQKQLGTAYRGEKAEPDIQWHDCTIPIDKDEITGDDLYDLPGEEGDYLVSIGDQVAVDSYDPDYGWNSFGEAVEAWAESPKPFKNGAKNAK